MTTLSPTSTCIIQGFSSLLQIAIIWEEFIMQDCTFQVQVQFCEVSPKQRRPAQTLLCRSPQSCLLCNTVQKMFCVECKQCQGCKIAYVNFVQTCMPIFCSKSTASHEPQYQPSSPPRRILTAQKSFVQPCTGVQTCAQGCVHDTVCNPGYLKCSTKFHSSHLRNSVHVPVQVCTCYPSVQSCL